MNIENHLFTELIRIIKLSTVVSKIGKDEMFSCSECFLFYLNNVRFD